MTGWRDKWWPPISSNGYGGRPFLATHSDVDGMDEGVGLTWWWDKWWRPIGGKISGDDQNEQENLGILELSWDLILDIEIMKLSWIIVFTLEKKISL